jgi:transcriptional regulator GlxA family with amidase domain
VAEVARSVGITHLGRFSGAYREEFGELPGETLRAARQHAG